MNMVGRQRMYVPDGYLALRDAIKYISRVRKPEGAGQPSAVLRQALISGTIRAAAVRKDGALVTMAPACWRRQFALPEDPRQEVGWNDFLNRPIYGPPARTRDPFVEALGGRAVPVAIARNDTPPWWGDPILARADLAAWCGAPSEPEPAERPADWPAPAAAPAAPAPEAEPAASAKEWMVSQVTRPGQWKRDDAIADCCKATGCTYREAVAAWMALPERLRRTRGRPRRPG
jgi:hypothetical protein